MGNATLNSIRRGKNNLVVSDGRRIRTEEWTVEEFLSLDSPFMRNRPVENRVKKKREELKKKLLLTHLEVKVGRAIKAFGNHKINDLFIIDGNTRWLVWFMYPELRPTYPLMVSVMDFDNEEEAVDTYLSIDSSTAAETSQEKIGGYFRSIGYVPTSKKVREGKISTTINDATKYIKYFNGVAHKNMDVFKKIEYMWDQMRYLDEWNLDPIKNLSSNLFTCMLMVGKKYGVNNLRFNEMIEDIKYETIKLDDKQYCDGVTYVMVYLFKDNPDKWYITGHKKAPELMYEMLYSLDLFMRNIPLKKKKNYSVSNSHEKNRIFFQSYFL